MRESKRSSKSHVCGEIYLRINIVAEPDFAGKGLEFGVRDGVRVGDGVRVRDGVRERPS